MILKRRGNKVAKCVECQTDLVAIGTEKFDSDLSKDNNWQWFKRYQIYIVCHCPKCDILYMREPKVVMG